MISITVWSPVLSGSCFKIATQTTANKMKEPKFFSFSGKCPGNSQLEHQRPGKPFQSEGGAVEFPLIVPMFDEPSLGQAPEPSCLVQSASQPDPPQVGMLLLT